MIHSYTTYIAILQIKLIIKSVDLHHVGIDGYLQRSYKPSGSKTTFQTHSPKEYNNTQVLNQL